MTDRDVRRGAGIYSTPVLGFYDLLVIHVSNSLIWRCPSEHMLAQYQQLLGQQHLDIGPGTGWYLRRALDPAQTSQLTLVDLNANSLKKAAVDLPTGITVTCAQADVLSGLPDDLNSFDSIAANYLLHCLPGSWERKGEALRNIARHLSDEGVFFGSTILGTQVGHTLTGKGMMALYNTLGIFHNRDDDLVGLKRILNTHFDEVSVTVINTVALFTARRPTTNH